MSLLTSPEWIFRKAASGDARCLADLGKTTYTQTFSHAYTPEKLKDYLNNNFAVSKIQEELKNEGVIYLLAETCGRAIGYAKLVQHKITSGFSPPAPIELERIYILSNWHGSGIAKTFLNTCITEAQQRAFKTLWLAVWEHNDRAKAFYAREGFQHVEVTKECEGVCLRVMARCI